MIYLTHNFKWSILGFDEEHFEWRGSFVKDELATGPSDNYYFPSLTTKDPYIYAFSPEKQTLIEIDKLTKNITRSLNIEFGSSNYNKCFVRNDDNYIYIYLNNLNTWETRLYKIDLSSFSVVSYVNLEPYVNCMIVDESYVYLVMDNYIYAVDKNTLTGNYYYYLLDYITAIGIDTSYVYLGGTYWDWETGIIYSVVRKYNKSFSSYTDYIYDDTTRTAITGLTIDDNYVYCIGRDIGKVHKIDKTTMTKVAESTLTITDTDCKLFTLANENILLFKLSDPVVVYKDIFTTPKNSLPKDYKPYIYYGAYMAGNERFQDLIPDGNNLYLLRNVDGADNTLFRIDLTNRTIKAQSPGYTREHRNSGRYDFICFDNDYVYWTLYHNPGGGLGAGYGKVLKLNKTTLEQVGSITIDEIWNMVSNSTNLFVYKGITGSQTLYSINKSSFTIQASISISYFSDMITEGEYLKVLIGGADGSHFITYDNNLNVISDVRINDRNGNAFGFQSYISNFESKQGYYYIWDFNSDGTRHRLIQIQGNVVQRVLNTSVGYYWADGVYVYIAIPGVLQRWVEDYDQNQNPIYTLQEQINAPISRYGIYKIYDQFIFEYSGTIKFQKIPLQILATDNKTVYGQNLNSQIYRSRDRGYLICYLSKDDLSIQDQWPIPFGLVDLPQNYIPGGYTPPGGGEGGGSGGGEGGGGGRPTGERVYGYIY